MEKTGDYFIIGDAVHDAAEFAEDLLAEIRWNRREAGKRPLRWVNPAEVRKAICSFLEDEYGYGAIPAEPYITIREAIMPHLKAAGVI